VAVDSHKKIIPYSVPVHTLSVVGRLILPIGLLASVGKGAKSAAGGGDFSGCQVCVQGSSKFEQPLPIVTTDIPK
jgi:hypothetical protein